MSEHLIKQEWVWVDSNEKLERAAEQWESKTLLALDTEFMRSKTYYPIAGLLQLNDGSKSYLIDPLKVSDFYPLIEIFDNSSIRIALHSCSEDLDVLNQLIGCVPAHIFDTQIACALLGIGFSMSYAAAVNAVLQVELPKSETRSDWLARPLSQSQIFYAALDVEYLHQLSAMLLERLNVKHRLDWLYEESAQIFSNFKQLQDAERAYLRIKGAWRLNARQLAILQRISRWRENAAQARDVPRNQVLKESALLDLACKAPSHISQLREFEGVNERMIRRDGETLIALIIEGNTLAEDALPPVLSAPLRKEEQQLLKTLRETVQNEAEHLGICPEICLKKKEYEAIVRDCLEHNSEAVQSRLSGWRREQFLPLVIEFIAHHETAR